MEERLIEEIKSELAPERRCQIFVTYTGERSVFNRFQSVLVNSGMRSATLESSSVPTEKREA